MNLLKIFVAMAALLTLSAAEARNRVVTTTTDLASLTELIGKDKVQVTPLCRANQDAHYLDATPGMVMRITRSDLFVENGLELELGWIPEVLRETRNRKVRRGGEGHVDASSGIQAIQVPENIRRDQGDVHPSGNPHYTLEPVISQQAARNIAQGLIRIDPKNREFYEKNLEEYIQKSNALVEEWKEKFKKFEGIRAITYHKHFDYMLKTLGVEVVDAIEPLPGLSPSAGHLARLLSTYDKESVSFVIMEPWHDRRVGKQVADGLDIPLVTGCPAVGSCKNTEDILSLFAANASMIYDALSKK